VQWRRAVIAGLAAGGAALLITAITLVPLIDAIPQTEEFRYRANSFVPPATTLARVEHVIGAELLPLIEGTAGIEVASHPKSISHAWLGSTYAGTLLFALAAYALVRARRRAAVRLSRLVIRVSASRAVLPLVLAAAAMFTMRHARAVIAVLFVLLIAQRGAETASLRPDVSQSALAPSFPGLEAMVSPEPFRI